MSSTVLTVDFVNNQGRDLNTRPRLSTYIVPGGPARRLDFLGLTPTGLATRAASSFGKSDYKGLIFGVKRRMSHGLDLTVNYTLQKANSTIGTAVDELNANNLQDATLLYDDPRVYGPATRVARHLLTVSAVVQVKGGIQLSSLFIFRTALPLAITEGADLNRNSENNDIPLKAYEFDGVNADGSANFKEIGDCKTWGCGRGAKQSQVNLRGSKRFNLHGTMAIEAFAEVFNLFNAKNPSAFTLTRTVSAGARLNPNFLKPTTYSGDFQQPDQRVGQLGVRFTF